MGYSRQPKLETLKPMKPVKPIEQVLIKCIVGTAESAYCLDVSDFYFHISCRYLIIHQPERAALFLRFQDLSIHKYSS